MNEMILKISLSMLIGGLIGIEREYRDKDAGIRTIMLICLGTTIFTMLSVANLNPLVIAPLQQIYIFLEYHLSK